ncbi:phage major tail tube protein [uncultured Dysosmobacter sp.]|uniref:phage major tail tube protein n=1 Tax=uncultured Dysosmobacter sp. TaxID=2591384 RepID=UPI002639FBC6|nr:phage major tail tube protein [uncultured Dysosmobacter sp.]
MIYPNGHVDYMMYKNGGALIGVAKVTVPTIKYKTVTATGAGLMGDVTIPLAGMIEAMLANIQFSSVTDAVVELGSNEWHDVSLYVAEQYFDSVNRREEIEQTRFEMSIRPTETNLGTIGTASAADASGAYSVCKYTVYKAGKKVIDLDQFNQVHDVNGKDCAADVRKAIGLT